MQAEKIRRGRSGGGFGVSEGALAQQVGYIACQLDRQFAFVEVGFAALALMCVVTGLAAHDAEEFVIAALQRAVFRQKPEMPFPEQRGAIARLFMEIRRDARRIRRPRPGDEQRRSWPPTG